MMKTVKLIIYITFITLLLTGFSAARERYGFIEINPSMKKIPIAVPLFKTTPDNMTELSRSTSDLLWESLEFTGYFKMLEREGYLEDIRRTGAISRGVDFRIWTRIGSELLITGGIEVSETMMVMELRLFDTFKEKLLVGKRYKGSIKDREKMIHKFCGEVIHHLTGNWGIFNSKLAFASSGSGNKEIYICDFNGKNPVKYTSNRSINLSPAWSYDGKWIAYTSYKRGKPDIYIEKYGQKIGYVVSKKGINTTPAWLPGQFKLAATMSFTGDQQIYLLSGRGKISRQLTNKWGIDESPAWSPDGKRLAFVSNRAGNPQIYIKNLETNHVERLTFEGRYNTQPSWSPKGDLIAYSAMEKDHIDIKIIGLDGSDPIRLTFDSGFNESPTWSPDGSMIAFSSTREGPARIFVMTAYGADQRRLLLLPGEQTNPDWSPRLINN